MEFQSFDPQSRKNHFSKDLQPWSSRKAEDSQQRGREFESPKTNNKEDLLGGIP